MGLIWCLIAVPLITAALLLVCKGERARRPITVGGAVLTAVLSVAVAAQTFSMEAGVLCAGAQFEFPQELSYLISWVMTGIDVVLCAVILWSAVRYKNRIALVLGLVQTVGVVLFAQMTLGAGASHMLAAPVYIDTLSLIMVLIVGLVGSAICVYALGYMHDFQHHQPADAPDRRHVFAALMFTFLAAMFVIVLSDNLE